MEWLSWLALILLTLVGYSAGAVLAASRRGSPRPTIHDLWVIPVVWMIVSSLRAALELNRWLALATGMAVGILSGWVIHRILPRVQPEQSVLPDDDGLSFLKRLFGRWQRFAMRIGDFQSRVILGYFYFTVALPFGLLVRWAVDPLRLRRPSVSSLWIERLVASTELDDARSQF